MPALVARLLLEWAAKQGTWMWLTPKDALALGQADAGGAGAGGTLAAIGTALLPLVLLLTGGLMLPASKLGTVGWDWQGWWRDPCEDHFAELSDDFIKYTGESASFPSGATRQSTGDLLGQARALINECTTYLRNCPNGKRAQSVRHVLANAEKGRDQYLDWLATH
jgi:hypothetical protein